MTTNPRYTKFNKWLLIFTTCIVTVLGFSLLALGIVGGTHSIKGASLFPASMFPMCGVLGGLVIIIAIIDFISIRAPRKSVIHLSLVMAVLVLIMQITLGVILQQKEENPYAYISDQWHHRSDNYRNHLQNEFECCGFANVFDDAVISDRYPANSCLSMDPCYYALATYIDNHFYKAHSFLFSTLSVEFIALLNGFIMLYLLKRKQKQVITTVPLNETVVIPPTFAKTKDQAFTIPARY